MRSPVPKSEPPRPGTIERARERLEHLYAISSHFVGFEDLERSFDAALAIAARTLPIRSAIVIVEKPDGSRTLMWPSRAQSATAMQAAKANAERTYAYLRGLTLEQVGAGMIEGLGATLLPPGAGAEATRFIAMPLVVGRAPVFGVAQLEAASPLDESDVIFVNAIATQLAVALERRRAWDQDIDRRDRAETGRAQAEVREARASQQSSRAVARLERFEGLVDSLHDIFVWEADPTTHATLYVSARAQALLGFSRHSWLDADHVWEERVHPEDRALVEATLEKVLATGRDARCEHRSIASDGRVVWFRTGVHLAGADTDAPRFQGVSVDVTAEKRAEERLREQLAFIRAIAQSLGEGVVAADLLDRVTFVNAAAASMIGTTTKAARAVTIGELLQMRAADGAEVEPALADVLRTGRPARSDKYFLARSDATTFPVSYTATPILSEGVVSGAVIAFDDISERRAVEDAQHILLSASQTLAADLDFPATVQNLAQMLVPGLGDFCGVHVLADGERLERVAWAHADAEQAEALGPALRAARSTELAGHPLEKVVRTGKTVLVRDRVEEWAAGLPEPGHRDLFGALGVRSLLMVPMAIGARRIGALTFAMTQRERRYDRSMITLAEEIARRAAYAVENGRLYAEARRQTVVREQILGVVSHDLKNPLNTIMMATAVLSEMPVAVAERQLLSRSIGMLERGADRTLRLIDDLLDFGSLEAGRLSVVLERIAPGALLTEALDSFHAAMLAKGLRVESVSEVEDAIVLADRDRILQVISNLLGNAIKVSPNGGRVTLRAVLRGADVVFSVGDEGPGISQDDLEHVFERYWRADDATYKGTGLGLAISAGIVAAHCGRIWAESTVGEGTTFSFTLPILPPPAS